MTFFSLWGASNMGDFVSNVARLLDETKTKEFNLGVQQGMQQGAYQAKLEIAENMIIAGAEDAYIAKITGLDIEKIKDLRRKHRN